MRSLVFIVIVTGCSGDGAEVVVDAPTGCFSQVGPPSGCIEGGLAGIVFDGSPWRLQGQQTHTELGPPTTTPVDEMITLVRTGTGCEQFGLGGTATPAYVDDTYVSWYQLAQGAREPYVKLLICKQSPGDALVYSNDTSGFRMQRQYTTKTNGTLTR